MYSKLFILAVIYISLPGVPAPPPAAIGGGLLAGRAIGYPALAGAGLGYAGSIGLAGAPLVGNIGLAGAPLVGNIGLAGGYLGGGLVGGGLVPGGILAARGIAAPVAAVGTGVRLSNIGALGFSGHAYLGGLGLNRGDLSIGVPYAGPVSAAIETYRTQRVIEVPTSPEVVAPTTLVIEPNLQPVNIEFRSQSSPVNINQVHLPGRPGTIQESQSEEEADILRHNVVKPVVQEVTETIVPFRRITQEILPVQEEVHSLVAKGVRQQALVDDRAVVAPAPLALAAPAIAPAPLALAAPAVAVAAPAIGLAGPGIGLAGPGIGLAGPGIGLGGPAIGLAGPALAGPILNGGIVDAGYGRVVDPIYGGRIGTKGGLLAPAGGLITTGINRFAGPLGYSKGLIKA